MRGTQFCRHVHGSTLCEPCVAEHSPEWADNQQRCRICDMKTHVFCPGCAKAEGSEPGAGFYCFFAGRNCLGVHHRKLERMPRAEDEA